jgi:hypothetical protein
MDDHLKEHISSGALRAIALDTSAIERNGLAFERGLLA